MLRYGTHPLTKMVLTPLNSSSLDRYLQARGCHTSPGRVSARPFFPSHPYTSYHFFYSQRHEKMCLCYNTFRLRVRRFPCDDFRQRGSCDDVHRQRSSTASSTLGLSQFHLTSSCRIFNNLSHFPKRLNNIKEKTDIPRLPFTKRKRCR